MSFAEAGVVIDIFGEPRHWHTPPDRSSGSLPDSRELWDVLWHGHKEGWLRGFAHSHPGNGLPHPSHEDITTFVAIENGLGRQLTWWITSADVLAVVDATSPALRKANNVFVKMLGASLEPAWVHELRRRSTL